MRAERAGRAPAPVPFAEQVRDALAHLHDLVRLQTHPLAAAARAAAGPTEPRHPGRALQQALAEAVEALRPRAGAAPDAGAERGHRLLELRYLEALPHSEVMRRLAVGRSLYFEEHRRALEAVVSLLWERWEPTDQSGATVPAESLPASDPVRPGAVTASGGLEPASPPGLPTGTVTFLLTDVERSTLLWEQDPGAMGRALETYDAVVERLTGRHGGAVVRPRGEGDSRFCVFARASDAVAAAGAIQRALHAEAWPTPSPVRVRMALHTGEADLRGGDYYGGAVNRCARLRALAHGGQTLVSAAVQRLLGDPLPPGLSLRQLGVHRLRDLAEPEHVFQLVLAGVSAEFPPLQTSDAPPNNLPLQLTSFVGREREVVEVKDLLGRYRLVCLTGAGGAGKTRLALQVAADLVGQYPQGVWFVDLAPLADERLVPHVALAALGVPERSDRAPLATLLSHLETREALLVLDNCEHLVAASAALAEALLRTCRQVRLLATSREPLVVPGEVAWRVPSLAHPDPDRLPPPEEVAGYAAVQLFVERARLVQPDFAVTAQNAASVVRVCQRLDGIPLAIELAAARLRVLSVEQIAARLHDAFDAGYLRPAGGPFHLLTGGARTALRRHQTLQAMVDWSHDLLAERERVLYRRLAVFAGGWTLDAAEDVCAFEPIGADEVLDLLTGLVDKSLVVADASAGEVRYRLLETIRQYAEDKLLRSGEAEVARRQHSAHYLVLAEQAEPQLRRSDQARWLARLQPEHGNLRTALGWLVGRGDAAGALRLAGALWHFWWAHGHRSEGRRRLAEVLALPGAEARSAGRARALLGAAAFIDTRETSRARPLLEEALAIFRELGDRAGTALALQPLVQALTWLGETAAARPLVEENLAIARELADPAILAGAVFGQALLASREGDLALARSLMTESLRGWREQGDRISMAYGLQTLGWTANYQGDLATTRALLEESLALFREIGDRWSVAAVLGDLGEVVTALGDYAAARGIYDQGLALWRELGDRQGEANMLSGVSYTVIEEGDFAAARGLLSAALAIRRESGDPLRVAWSLGGFAYLAAAQGQAARALRLAGAAAALREASGRPVPASVPGKIERRLGNARAALGEAAREAWAEGQAMPLEAAVAYALESSL